MRQSRSRDFSRFFAGAKHFQGWDTRAELDVVAEHSAWSESAEYLVGSLDGTVKRHAEGGYNESLRQEKDLIPPGVNWIKEKVASFQPEKNQVTLASGTTVAYDYLVVAPGIQIDWNKVEGLTESIGKSGVCSNYDPRYVDSTWAALQSLQEGDAVFTMPSTSVKCGGAPQKIAYLAADYLRRSGRTGKTRVHLYTAGAKLFAVPEFEKVLSQTVARYGIQTHFGQDLVKPVPSQTPPGGLKSISRRSSTLAFPLSLRWGM